MSRQHQFKVREESILSMAEQLLLESGNGNITLDSLAEQLDLAKGTLYKHFSSKDELYLRIIIRYEEQLYAISQIDDCPSAGVTRTIMQQLLNPQKALLLNQIEERLADSATGLNRMFAELYEVRRARMKYLIAMISQYLQSQNSELSTRDYLSSIWAIGQGGAGLLNSSFYQRYLGRRDTLRFALVKQMLDLPKQYPRTSNSAVDSDMEDLVDQIDSETQAHLESTHTHTANTNTNASTNNSSNNSSNNNSNNSSTISSADSQRATNNEDKAESDSVTQPTDTRID